MNWEIYYYNKRVYRSIQAWPERIKANYLRIIDLMQRFGPNLGMPYTKKLVNELFEIRSKGNEGIGRAFFCYMKYNKIIIVHSMIKKSQKTPNKEIKLALQRTKEILHQDERRI